MELVEFDICWHSDCTIYTEFHLLERKIKCCVHNISVQGHVRMCLANLVPAIPFFKFARVSFTTKPQIDLKLKLKNSTTYEEATLRDKGKSRSKMADIAIGLFEQKLIEELRMAALYPRYIEILL